MQSLVGGSMIGVKRISMDGKGGKNKCKALLEQKK